MKYFPITSLLLASLLLLSACQEDNVLPADGTSCPGSNNFIVQDGACICPEDYILVGQPPSVLGEDANEGICIRPSNRGINIVFKYNDCMCTEVPKRAPHVMLLNLSDIFSARYFSHGDQYITIWRNTHWADERDGQDIYLEFLNSSRASPWIDACEDYPQGIYGRMHEFFPNDESHVEGIIHWWATREDLDRNVAPVDSCTTILERVTP